MLNALKEKHKQLLSHGKPDIFAIGLIACQIAPFVLYGCTNYYVNVSLIHLCLLCHMPQMIACTKEVTGYDSYMNDLFLKLPQHVKASIEEEASKNDFSFSGVSNTATSTPILQ